jgi:hypothetical protein
MRRFATFLFFVATTAQAASFQTVRDRIYREPQTNLPEYPGLGLGDALAAILRGTGGLIDRAAGTLTSNEDFKPRAPKLLHPMGVCADAT